jgi:hypothetical protein
MVERIVSWKWLALILNNAYIWGADVPHIFFLKNGIDKSKKM